MMCTADIRQKRGWREREKMEGERERLEERRGNTADILSVNKKKTTMLLA